MRGKKKDLYLYAIRAVLHIDPVVLVVPQDFYPLVMVTAYRVCNPSGGLKEKIPSNVSLAHQYQHPAMDSQPVELVRRRGLRFLVDIS